MKRFSRVLAAVLTLGAVSASAAQAASSPTVITGAAGSITPSSAELQGRVNPNGSSTSYYFELGTTTSYGVNTSAHALGGGRKGLSVARTVSGLTPGTVYHYRIDAVNRSGTSSGADRTFTTGGPPPPSAVTGPATQVRKTQALVTGSINPNGAATSWIVQYGLTANYTAQSAVPLALSAVNAPLGVSTTLTGLSPATLFHYRIVAYHGLAVAGVGADATFFTQPFHRPQSRMSVSVSPKAARRGPWRFSAKGSIAGGKYIPAAQRCTGSVALRIYNGKRQLDYGVAAVGSDCRFSGEVSFRRTHHNGRATLRYVISYRGNGYLAPTGKTLHVSAG